MGEQQLDQVTSDELFYIPAAAFARVRESALAPGDRARVFAAIARVNTLYMIARAWSGHIGTSFSSLEIMSWLFLNEMRDLDRGPAACDIFFSSKGHDAPALYNVLIGMGLMPPDKMHELRRLHGLPGHPHVETPYIQANTGSLGMGISKAKGMAIANRALGTPRRIFVLTGDGELQEGQFWESLASAVHDGLHEITVIVDHNKIQSDTWVAEVSDLGDIEAKVAAFGWRVARMDGHDLASIEKTLTSVRERDGRPVLIVADTIKGKGVSFMEGPAMKPGTLYDYHSGAPNEEQYALGSRELLDQARALFAQHGLGELPIESGRRPARKPVLAVERLVNAYGDALVEHAARDPRIIALDADLVKDCGLVPFQTRFPERFVECGIAEQDMVSMASGMARRGALPIVHSFACFLAARPNEQIYNNASESSRVIYVGSLAGLLPGGPGHSHQSVRDISALAAVPKLVLVEPCTERETRQLVDWAIAGTTESVYLRLVSLGWPMPFDVPDAPVIEGRGRVVRESTNDGKNDGADVVVFGYGPWLLANAWEAADRLAADGTRVKIVDLPWLNRVDREWLAGTIRGASHVITLDNHYVHGGQGQMIAAAVAAIGGPRVTSIGVTALPVCGANDEVLAHHHLDAAGIAGQIAEALGAVRA